MTRIIAGAAGSLRLSVPRSGTRPTSDRVREAIFSTLTSWNLDHGTRVLDLYAGSGALGLEAASRGANSVTLVERHPQAAQVIDRNAKVVASAFRGRSAPTIRVVRASVQTFLLAEADQSRSRAATPTGPDETVRGMYDVVLIDPPYDLAEPQLAENLAALDLVMAEDAVVMVERSVRTPEPSWPASLVRVREKRYGETVLWWAERRSA